MSPESRSTATISSAVQAMIKVVESENPPMRLPFGEGAVTAIEAELELVKQDIAARRALAIDTAFGVIPEESGATA